VIELDFFPILLNVAALAFGPEVTFMLVIFLVTLVTGIGCFAVFLAFLMTGIAFYFGIGMFTLQCVVGLIMVKRIFVQRNNDRITPFVIGVAFLTFFLFFDTSVETTFFRQVFADILMTISAQPGLRAFIEFLMTFFAILLFLRVSLNQVARHYQFIGMSLHR
jgi:hypothetical protein